MPLKLRSQTVLFQVAKELVGFFNENFVSVITFWPQAVMALQYHILEGCNGLVNGDIGPHSFRWMSFKIDARCLQIPYHRGPELVCPGCLTGSCFGELDLSMSREELGVPVQGSWRSLDHRGRGRPESMRGSMAIPETDWSPDYWRNHSLGNLGGRGPGDGREHHCVCSSPEKCILSVLHTDNQNDLSKIPIWFSVTSLKFFMGPTTFRLKNQRHFLRF